MENHRWATKYPELGTEPVSTDPYVSEEFYRDEQELFRRSWLNVAHIDDVPEPGDFMVREVAICNASILVVRDLDGEVRCFHNVCSHRGNQLVWDPDGSSRGYLTCRFHGWSYDLTGRLASITDADNFFGMDKCQLGLTPVSTAMWHGFIFVNLQAEPTETLEGYLEGLVDQVPSIPPELKLTFRYDVEEDTNWKVALDAQNESYHAPVLGPVHAAFGDFFIRTDDGYVRMDNFKRFGKHTLYCVAMDPEYRADGVQKIALESIPPTAVEVPNEAAFDFYVLFPNFVFGFLTGQMFTYNFWPLAVGKTLWEIRLYLPPPQNAAELLGHHYNKAKLRDALAEDIAGHERVYDGVASRAKKLMFLQDEEVQIRSFHKTLIEAVNTVRAEAGR